MSDNINIFLQEMIEKLSFLNEAEFSKYEFLKDVCEFFDISHGFIYESNHIGVFNKKEYYEVINTNSLKDEYSLKDLLGLELLSELCSKKVVICEGDTKKDEIETKLCDILQMNTLIFIPILNQHYEIAGFVGIGDRRRKARCPQADLYKSCALLSLLANNIKLEMFQKGIANTEAALSNVLDHIGIDIYVNDYYTHDVLYVNKSMAAPYGGVENMIGKKCWGTIFDDKTGPCDFCPQPKLLDENGNLNKTYTWDYERPFDKSWFRVLSSSFTWSDGRIAHLVASVDITENKKNQMLIEKLAQYDYLTGLPNRRSLQDDVQAFVEDDSKFSDKWYLLFCDLDKFKEVNDTLGHFAGDALLKGIAEKLEKICSDDVRAYRQGGDEFVLIVKDNKTEEEFRKLIDCVFKIFTEEYQYDEKAMKCGCSIGVAHYPEDATNVKEIFHLADKAMYKVKKENKNTIKFSHNGDFIKMEDYLSIKMKNQKI